MLEHRKKVEALIAEAQEGASPRSISRAAEELRADANRLLSRIVALEERFDEIEASGALTTDAEAAFFRNLHDMERALSRVRSNQIVVAARFPEFEQNEDETVKFLELSTEIRIVQPGCADQGKKGAADE